jgi:hypothetical protein
LFGFGEFPLNSPLSAIQSKEKAAPAFKGTVRFMHVNKFVFGVHMSSPAVATPP